MREEDTSEEFKIPQELDGVDPNATFRLTSVFAFHKHCPILEGAMTPYIYTI